MQTRQQKVQNFQVYNFEKVADIDRTIREKGKSDSTKDYGKMESVLPVMSN